MPDTLQDFIHKLQAYYNSNPGLKFQGVNATRSNIESIPQLLSGSESTEPHLGTTFPMLLAGALQSDLIKRFNTGELKPADVQREASNYKQNYSNLHDTFVDDVLRHIGYEVNIVDNKVSPEPKAVPQDFTTNSFDPGRG